MPVGNYRQKTVSKLEQHIGLKFEMSRLGRPKPVRAGSGAMIANVKGRPDVLYNFQSHAHVSSNTRSECNRIPIMRNLCCLGLPSRPNPFSLYQAAGNTSVDASVHFPIRCWNRFGLCLPVRLRQKTPRQTAFGVPVLAGDLPGSIDSPRGGLPRIRIVNAGESCARP